MTLLLILLSATAAAAQPAPPAPQPKLADLPNVDVSYYDVTGKTVREIHQSVARASPADPVTGKRLPATSSWNLTAAVKWTRTGERCRIDSVDLKFTGRATLPRLAVQPDTPPPVLAAWNDYVARLDARQARQLAFAYDRRAGIERAIREAGCAAWQAAGALAIDRIREEHRLAFKDSARDQPKLLEPNEFEQDKPAKAD